MEGAHKSETHWIWVGGKTADGFRSLFYLRWLAQCKTQPMLTRLCLNGLSTVWMSQAVVWVPDSMEVTARSGAQRSLHGGGRPEQMGRR